MLKEDNIICILHLGASSEESEKNCAYMACKEIVDFFKYGVINNSVNYPSINQVKTCDYRIIVIHKNIPGMLAQISNAYSNLNFNIESLFSKANEKYAISIFDTHTKVSEQVIKNIESVDGVIRVIVD